MASRKGKRLPCHCHVSLYATLQTSRLPFFRPMTVVAIDRPQSATAWPAQTQFNPRTLFQSGPPTYIPAESPLPPHNDVKLSRDMLIDILEYFSQLVARLFTGRTIRMVVHGGACMLLHPGLYSLSLNSNNRWFHLYQAERRRQM